MGQELKDTVQARARRLLVEAALDLTKIKGPMRRACLMVLCDGFKPAEAARKVKGKRQHVYRAVKRLRPHLDTVTQYANSL